MALRSAPRRDRSLGRRLLRLQLLVFTVLVLAATALTLVAEEHGARDRAAQRGLDVAWTVARTPTVTQALDDPDPSAVLQPFAESVRSATGVNFITVMAPDRTRYTHTNPEEIGRRFLGHVEPALAGRAFTETYTGTLGPSVRAVVPVTDDGGRVRALVSVGIGVDRVSESFRARIPGVLGFSALGLCLAAVAALLISRRIHRQTLGLGPEELARLYQHHDAVLHAVREGLLILTPDGRVTLANDEAQRLLGLPPAWPDQPDQPDQRDRRDRPGQPGQPAADAVADPAGRPLGTLGLPAALVERLVTGRVGADEMHLVGDRVLIVNRQPVVHEGRELGAVVTFRDRTELEAVSSELDSVRGFTESLRAQAHEAANRLHTVVTMVELGRTREAVEFATEELAATQALTDEVVSAVDEPAVAALLLGKAAQAHERGVRLDVSADGGVAELGLPAHDLVTVIGNLVDNAIDAAAGAAGAAGPAGSEAARVWVSLRTGGADGPAGAHDPTGVDDASGAAQEAGPVEYAGPGVLTVTVRDTGPGLPPEAAEEAFTRGWSTKGATGRRQGRGLGLALARQSARRHGGTVRVARRPHPEEEGREVTVFTATLRMPARVGGVPRGTVGAPAGHGGCPPG
ncbi:sensor histidine kinase [Allostreptomyces psammosilenae]|uniref:histidine kinase n=1 Tax=Allostreptomyces psammosilenae TaxID=1892865 RepID=A0A853A5W1_9ACTN|nr:sensor histidine kinase [Allostreptomyces psammosilenae]NYI08234.1 two-component system CitB family sensor kinase [Allostreptomyces psammosilenae]